MLNPFADNSMSHYLDRFTRAFAAYDGPRPRAMYHDSYEYGANWSPDVLAEFQRRQGYRLQDELPALAGNGSADHVARVKCDYRETLSDIMIERFIPPWTDWSPREGFVTRYRHRLARQLAGPVRPGRHPQDRDVPHRPQHAGLEIRLRRRARGGPNLTAAETGTSLKEHFTETLADVKNLVNQMFPVGREPRDLPRHVLLSPDAAPWPGWVFYASTEMNPRNSIWYDVRTLNDYIARCQAVLQSGRPDNDLLVYWPVYDLWHGHGKAVYGTRSLLDSRYALRGRFRRSWASGYGFDYISDRQIAAAKTADGKIVVPGGAYRHSRAGVRSCSAGNI